MTKALKPPKLTGADQDYLGELSTVFRQHLSISVNNPNLLNKFSLFLKLADNQA